MRGIVNINKRLEHYTKIQQAIKNIREKHPQFNKTDIAKMLNSKKLRTISGSVFSCDIVTTYEKTDIESMEKELHRALKDSKNRVKLREWKAKEKKKVRNNAKRIQLTECIKKYGLTTAEHTKFIRLVNKADYWKRATVSKVWINSVVGDYCQYLEHPHNSKAWGKVATTLNEYGKVWDEPWTWKTVKDAWGENLHGMFERKNTPARLESLIRGMDEGTGLTLSNELIRTELRDIMKYEKKPFPKWSY